MKKTINVTARDIKLGCKANGEGCPIYRAAKRLKIGVTWVYPSCIQIGKTSIWLPQDATDFVYAYDSGKRVKPFKFTIDV